VLESPVRSGYWAPGGSNRDRDRLAFALKPKITGLNRCKPVTSRLVYGYITGFNRSRLFRCTILNTNLIYKVSIVVRMKSSLTPLPGVQTASTTSFREETSPARRRVGETSPHMVSGQVRGT
jgi:hypothetical protein